MNIVPFQFEAHAVRVVADEHGEPWFVGKDVAEALGYSDHTSAVRQHCKGVAKHHPLPTVGGLQEFRVLSEPDVLRLIVSSKLPSAEAFERLVFEEILPSIRRTGGYTAPKSKKAKGDRSGLDKLREARALEISMSVAGQLCDRFPSLGEHGRQVIFAKIVNQAAGADVVPLPRLEEHYYSASEVGERLGITAHRVGSLANRHGLKTEQYGMYVLDKSRYSSKEVETFRYNERGVTRLAELVRE